MEIQSQRVEIPVGGARMGAYLARPKDAAPRPGVIVWMEIFGVNAHIRDVTERVAREGYLALAPDFFHRSFPGLDVGYDEKGMEVGHEGPHRARRRPDDRGRASSGRVSGPRFRDARAGSARWASASAAT